MQIKSIVYSFPRNCFYLELLLLFLILKDLCTIWLRRFEDKTLITGVFHLFMSLFYLFLFFFLFLLRFEKTFTFVLLVSFDCFWIKLFWNWEFIFILDTQLVLLDVSWFSKHQMTNLFGGWLDRLCSFQRFSFWSILGFNIFEYILHVLVAIHNRLLRLMFTFDDLL